MNFNLVEMYNGLLRFNLFSVFAFLDTTPTTIYYSIKYNKLKT